MRIPSASGRILFSLFAGLFVLSLAAQQPAERPPEKCIVEGTVVSADTKQPLRKAQVILSGSERGAQPRVVSTDAAGRFSFAEAEPGSYRLSVERNGYVRQQYGQRGQNPRGALLTLLPGQHIRGLLFRLIPWGVVAGRVTDEDGEPMPGVMVEVLRHSYGRMGRQLAPTGGAATNDLGEYRVYGLAPGKYLLSARYNAGGAPGFFGGRGRFGRLADEGSEDAYAPVYYPDTSDPSRAVAVEVAAGAEVRQINFTLIPSRAFRVRGTVFNSVSGKPAQGAQVWLLPREAGPRSFLLRAGGAVQDAQGKFEIRVPTPGSYFLMGMQPEEGRVAVGRLPLEVGSADVEGVTLVLGPSAEVAGRLVVEGGAPEGGSRLRVTLTPREPMPFFGGGSAGVDADGAFTVRNLPEDTYLVNAQGLPEGFFLKSARVGNEDVLERGLAVGRDKSAPLELALSPNGARVEGQVLTEESFPVPGATVVLVPAPARRHLQWQFKTAMTDQAGRFSLAGISPGAYRLYAWEEVEPEAWHDPDFLQPLEPRGRSLELNEGEQKAAEVRVIPAATARR